MSAYLNFNYPLQLKLAGKKCVVIGGGRIAERKVRRLLTAGALITVIAPVVTTFLQESAQQQQQLILYLRPYHTSDLKGAFLVVAATNDRTINARIAEEADKLQLLVNVVDAPQAGNFLVPGTYDLGQITFTVAGSGTPLLTKLLLEDLQTIYGEDVATFAAFLSAQRTLVQTLLPTPDSRSNFWRHVLTPDLLHLVKTGQRTVAEASINTAIQKLKDKF